MKKKYETLDEYLDDLDKIKEKIAAETAAMTPKEAAAYFNQALHKAEKIIGRKLRVQRPRKRKTAIRQKSR